MADNVSLSPNLISWVQLVTEGTYLNKHDTYANGHGVIFINNRDRPHMEKALEGISGVISGFGIDHGILCQQYLSRRLIILCK